MFKKAAAVAFKGETRIRGKESKRLHQAVASTAGDEIAAALFPNKAEVVIRKAGGSTFQFIFVNGECFYVQLDGKAELGTGELLPTLQALWRVEADALLPSVVIQRPVAKFIFGGANVMAPGVHSIVPTKSCLPKEGCLVAVRAEGNSFAAAVGRLRMAPNAIVGSKGEAVEVLHFFGDALWEVMGSPRPAGFIGDQIHPTEAQEEKEERGVKEEEIVQAPAPEAEVKDMLDQPDRDMTHMIQNLEECLLQACKTRIKDRDLPLPGNVLYAQHMRPCRRAGSNIDVKATPFKKLSAFLSHVEEKGWLALKKNSSDPIVTRIFRDHPDVTSWKPWPKEATAEVEESKGTDSSPTEASIQIEVVWRIGKLKPLLEELKTEAADGCWTREDCAAALKAYADSHELWLKNNKKRIGPDALLCSLISSELEVQSGQSYSLDGLADDVLRTLPLCHRVTAPQGGAAGGFRRYVRPGKPPVVQVRTDTRRGHHVTLIHGLEAYGIDMQALAAELQKALASAATVEQASPTQVAAVMVQGFWDVAVAEWLGKAGVPAESILQQVR
ncbi:unnamed protein product [Durusdinium trenchii]|uniref:SUI1 domain-containing protein n=1 Tax=Durusdinium trenchii TaxID=1381693 RepID=A0ABP0HEQ1_9DINO